MSLASWSFTVTGDAFHVSVAAPVAAVGRVHHSAADVARRPARVVICTVQEGRALAVSAVPCILCADTSRRYPSLGF